jgi:hypothetical protein
MKNDPKSFPQGLKPNQYLVVMSELKLRPPVPGGEVVLSRLSRRAVNLILEGAKRKVGPVGVSLGWLPLDSAPSAKTDDSAQALDLHSNRCGYR